YRPGHVRGSEAMKNPAIIYVPATAGITMAELHPEGISLTSHGTIDLAAAELLIMRSIDNDKAVTVIMETWPYTETVLLEWLPRAPPDPAHATHPAQTERPHAT